MIIIVRAVQTCWAAPSQWDAWDADGNYYYLRYRGGHGSVDKYTDEHWYERVPFEKGEAVAEFQYGHPLDGYIDLAGFARLAGLELSPDLAETGFGDYIRDELITGGVLGPEIPGEESQ
jgi:hypothetical protein